VAPNLPEVTLTAEVRHNVFLVIKEALNNCGEALGSNGIVVAPEAVSDGVMTH
jgi:hypothetical protein